MGNVFTIGQCITTPPTIEANKNSQHPNTAEDVPAIAAYGPKAKPAPTPIKNYAHTPQATTEQKT